VTLRLGVGLLPALNTLTRQRGERRHFAQQSSETQHNHAARIELGVQKAAPLPLAGLMGLARARLFVTARSNRECEAEWAADYCFLRWRRGQEDPRGLRDQRCAMLQVFQKIVEIVHFAT
jgi:hypothetical protein